MKKLVLVDGHAILHRAYYALPQTLRTRKGEPVNAVYGFVRMLLKVISDIKPDYLAVAFDLPVPTFRHKEYIGYQAQRPKMEAELADQLARIQEVLQGLNIPLFAVEGFEADDVIGTLAKQAAQRGIETVIVTGDKDMMQLVNRQVKVYAPVRGFSEAKLFGPKEVEDSLGITPEQIVDYKALVGDASDNYPGVPGIGPKTAVWLLGKFRRLGGIYQKTNQLPQKIGQKLVAGKDSAELSRKLAKIVTNVSIKLDLKTCRFQEYDQEKVIELFEKLEFKSLIEALPGMKKPATRKAQKADKNSQKGKQTRMF